MLRSVQSLHRCNILATDGIAGRVQDVVFDDRTWSVLYWVVDTGALLSRSLILLSRDVIGKPDWTLEYLPVVLSKREVIEGTGADHGLPTARRYVKEALRYPGCECLWPPGWYYVPLIITSPDDDCDDTESICEGKQIDSRRLRSGEVLGYSVQATDGAIGVLGDILVDVDRWTVRYLTISTPFRSPGGTTAVPVRLVSGVSVAERRVNLKTSKAVIRYSQGYETSVDANEQFHVRRHAGGTGPQVRRVSHRIPGKSDGTSIGRWP